MGSSRKKPLTIKEVEKLTAELPHTIRHHALGGVPGFVLIHTPKGYTGYGLFYRHRGKLRKLTLGSTKMLKLADARKLALQHRYAIEAGRDPHGEKIAARRAPVGLDGERMWEKYLTLAASQLRSKPEKERVFKRYLKPVIGRLPVSEVKRAHALEVIDPLVAAGKLRMADKVRQEGAAWFQWLLEREHVERNPFAGLRKAEMKKVIRTRVLTDQELREIWIASDPEGRWGLWFKLMILTGTRNMEARAARWSEFDLENRTWTVPLERSKNKVEQRIYLTNATLAIVEQVPRFPDVDLLFPASGNMKNPMSGDQKVKDSIDERMRAAIKRAGGASPPNWQIHDFRRTIATGLQRLGYRPDIADQVIGHVGSTRSGAAAHYLHHMYEEEKREALETWSRLVEAIVAGQGSATDAMAEGCRAESA
jgi:integrase